jgi:hypothetical protein
MFQPRHRITIWYIPTSQSLYDIEVGIYFIDLRYHTGLPRCSQKNCSNAFWHGSFPWPKHVVNPAVVFSLVFKPRSYPLRLRRAYPAPLGRAGVGSIPANPDAQNVPSFRRWRFEMKLSPFFLSTVAVYHGQGRNH